MQRFLLLAITAGLVFWFYTDRDSTVATATDAGLTYPSYAIEPQKPYQMQARILGTKRYRTGREAELSPFDLALGWGPMMDLETLEEIEISQRHRFYYWKVSNFPIPRKDIEHHSANVHIIPANQEVADKLAELTTGDIVELSGQLINVSADDGWRWHSSLSFTDTGKGACELLWLETLTTT